ncbi:ATP phosphoribosyltransferase regulatory subunit [Piscinibacter sakaiensis]|uniref:ATP phosphoribosyltransferase regulatory subunit n=1 Tax=Piscinibacter sakaiensis TaxID=1547922 RepID=UPI00372867C9
MTSAWLLPEHISDVLPAQARHIEELRRGLLDAARRCGYELVIPPMLEHLESLLSGTGHELDLKTFKLADQLSGRTLGVRADSTPQVARIDAHLLNRQGVARLCYCGPVLHTRPSGLHGSREPLQFGAELYGHAGLEAEHEVLDLAVDCLAQAGIGETVLDLGDTRIVRGLLAGVPVDAARLDAVVAALAAKDASALAEATAGFPEDSRRGLLRLPGLYGAVDEVLVHPGVRLGVDLGDLGGYAYYSGSRFAVYAAGSSDALLRGGRYDEVGAVFGRNRPAVGFSLDVKALAPLVAPQRLRAAIRAPWGDDAALRAAVRRLREQGDTVVCVLPGHGHEGEEFDCDRELVEVQGQWVLRAL